MRWTAATLCSVVGLHAAVAQPAPAAGPPAAPPLAAEPAVAVDARGDAAWRLYHDAFAALMQGERTRARELAGSLLRDYPDHPATRLVRAANLGFAPGAVEDRSEPSERRETRETASRAARAELALFQSLHGVALGIEACIALDCDGAGAVLGLALAGGGIGAAVSLNLSGLTSGQRALLNSGTAWGAVNAGLLIAVAKPEAQGGAAMLMAGQGAGLLTGAMLFRLHPTAGQVALANSGGQWAGVLGALVIAASGAELSSEEYATAVLIAIDAGIASGAYLASTVPQVSRAQTLVIDAGGIVGGIGGGGLGIVIAGHSDDRTTPALAALGAVVGLGAAAYFTRDWTEGSATSLHSYLAPPHQGRGAVAGVGFAW